MQAIDTANILLRPRHRHVDTFVWELYVFDRSSWRSLRRDWCFEFGWQYHLPDVVDQNLSICKAYSQNQTIRVKLYRANLWLYVFTALHKLFLVEIVVNAPCAIVWTHIYNSLKWSEAHTGNLLCMACNLIYHPLVLQIPYFSYTLPFKNDDCNVVFVRSKQSLGDPIAELKGFL